MGALMRKPTAIATMVLLVCAAAACDDRRERVEETAAPGMEQDAAAPASGPVDLDVDTIQPGQMQQPGAGEVQPQTMPPVTPEGQQPPPERQQGQPGQQPPG